MALGLEISLPRALLSMLWKMRAFWLFTKGSLMSEILSSAHIFLVPFRSKKAKGLHHGLQEPACRVSVHPGYPFPPIGGHPIPWNHMDSVGPLGLQQGDGAPGCPQEALPCPSNSPELVQECLRQFKVTGAQLRQIQASLLGSMEQALSGQANPAPTVRMLPTYVGSVPHGTEQGDFVVLELGAIGASLRVLWVTLMGTKGHRMEPQSREFVIPQEVMVGPGQQLFDFAARCLSEFLDAFPVGNQGLQLGFSFSFPCHQTGLDKSTLISWTKGFRCSGVEGQDVVQLLRDAIQRQGAYSIDVVAVVNDAVGTMMGCEPGAGPCEVGLVVDTGTNACYMEEARHVAVLDEDRGRVCISVEWGSFSDDGALGPVLTTFDHALDHESLNPGAQRWPVTALFLPSPLSLYSSP